MRKSARIVLLRAIPLKALTIQSTASTGLSKIYILFYTVLPAFAAGAPDYKRKSIPVRAHVLRTAVGRN